MPRTAIGQWIREKRLLANLNQTQLGAEFDVHQVTISNWETGKSEPTPQDVRALEAFFRGPTPRSGPEPSLPAQPKASPRAPSAKAPLRPKRQTSKAGVRTAAFRHEGEKRTNIPPAKMAGEGRIPRVPKARYSYDPHLPPLLRFDQTGRADFISDRIDNLIEKAGAEALTDLEQNELREAVRHYRPWLEWAGKREQQQKGWFDVDPVALHIHERLSAQAIVRAARREDLQRDLFADPQLPYQETVQFYRHDIDWTNRIILGDSLHVMSSLATREALAGKVQMIFMDPPYGIKFPGNFQPEVRLRSSAESARSLTREAEMVRAYRDTWHLGTHSYLAYLRDRLIVARELLTRSGSLFLQIGSENVHWVKALLDAVFGAENCAGIIPFKKTGGQSTTGLPSIVDFLLWYGRDATKLESRTLYSKKTPGDAGATNYTWVEEEDGNRRNSKGEARDSSRNQRVFQAYPLFSEGASSRDKPLEFQGRFFVPSRNSHWKTTATGLARLKQAERLLAQGKTLRFVNYLEDYPITPLTNVWMDTQISGFREAKLYVVWTAPRVVERCLLMTTRPGDLVLDPTCGSGTTAYVAEQWGRRWITVDTSRVAVAIARQRLLTAKYDHYTTAHNGRTGGGTDPRAGFRYKTVPHITLKSIAQNSHLDPIFENHRRVLKEKLLEANRALALVDDTLRDDLATKLRNKEKVRGKQAVTEADRRRWLLPPRNRSRSAAGKELTTVDWDVPRWYEWEVPFDTDEDWPEELQRAVTAFRKAWREKRDEVQACINANAPHEELVDDPHVTNDAVRVSGPFTVEGVMPAERALHEQSLFEGVPEHLTCDTRGRESAREVSRPEASELQNVSAYLHRMVKLLRDDGVTFPNNRHRAFARIEPLFEDGNGSGIHADGLWHLADATEPNNVAVAFGPQYGPVTAKQVEDLVRASRRYDELVIAGFSFDAAATAIVQEQHHPQLTIHQAHVRPDINPAMEDLLQDPKKGPKRRKNSSPKATPRAASSYQLFTVFGLPEIELSKPEGSKDERVCELLGVDIYDPITGEVRPTGATKVAAWFLDSDYDGRCFCITQAFFPNQKAWEKIQKALKTSADPKAFAAFKGTISLPFRPGKHRRIAVKVIDPRGNEVMTIRALEG